jgi:PAS domain S-box-containing protein
VHGDDLRSLLQLPIVVDGKPVACLLLGSRLTSRIAPATLHSLAVLGRYFGQTLQRLDSLEESSRLQHNLSGIFDTLTDFIFVLDMECTILHYNRAVAETLGYGREALKGKPILAVHPQNLRDIAEQRMADLIAGRSLSWPLPILCANGQQLQVETRVASGYWDGKPALIGVSQDISERLHAEERQRLAASVFDNAHEGIMITDQSGRIIEVNSTFTELTGYTREEAVGSTPDLLKSGHHDAAFYLEMWAKIRVDGYWRGEIWNRKKTGEIFVEQLTISTVRNRDGEISHYVAIFSDITLIKQHQQRLEHLAHFDALTQLPNRMLLSDRLQLAKAQSERAAGKQLAVCYLDLDNFKPINDEYGHSVGDYLLIDVAQRLKTCVRAAIRWLAWAATNSCCSSAISKTSANATTPWPASSTPWPSPSASRSDRWPFRPVSASPSTRATAPTPTPCSATPTRRCMPPSRPAATATTCSIRKTTAAPGPPRRTGSHPRRAGQERVPPALPAQGGHAQRHGDWCRSADPLAAPGARPVAAGHLPAGHRRQRAGDRDRRLGDQRNAPPDGRLAPRAWPRTGDQHQHLRRPSAASRFLPAPGRSAGRLPGGFPG